MALRLSHARPLNRGQGHSEQKAEVWKNLYFNNIGTDIDQLNKGLLKLNLESSRSFK
jgi:hypothetical protein